MDSEHKMTLRDTIIPKSDQLNYDDLLTGPVTVRVTSLKAGSPEQPVIVEIVNAETGETMRPFKPCKSMRRVLISAWGDKGKDWLGKLATLYGDPDVKFGGVAVGGIRVSAVSGIDKHMNMRLTVSKAKRAEYVVRPIAEGGAE
jgi:hypothetical protein